MQDLKRYKNDRLLEELSFNKKEWGSQDIAIIIDGYLLFLEHRINEVYCLPFSDLSFLSFDNNQLHNICFAIKNLETTYDAILFKSNNDRCCSVNNYLNAITSGQNKYRVSTIVENKIQCIQGNFSGVNIINSETYGISLKIIEQRLVFIEIKGTEQNRLKQNLLMPISEILIKKNQNDKFSLYLGKFLVEADFNIEPIFEEINAINMIGNLADIKV